MYQFSRRTEAPLPSNETDTENYFSTHNIYYSSGYGMPNCTAYALGRVNELSRLNNLGYAVVSGFAGNGGLWGNDGFIGSDWVKSTIPKLGAVAVFEQEGHDGHVAMVEAINDDGTIEFSNSGWSDTNRTPSNPLWWWIRSNTDVNNWGSYKFRYYLYPPYIDSEPIPPTPSAKKDWLVLAMCGALPNNL